MFGLFKRILTQNYYNKKAPEAFEHFYKYSDESESYLNYCKSVHKRNFPLQSNASPSQLDYLDTQMSEIKPKRVLDLGCGTGHLYRQYKSQYGFKGLGLDFAIPNATGDLVKANFENYNFKDQKFDLIYSIDSLYMMNNLRKVVNRVYKQLDDNGSFIIFYTSVDLYEKSPLNKALKKLGLDPEVINMSEDDKTFWEDSFNKLEQMKKSFFDEGNVSIWKTKYNEAQKNMELHQRNSLFRYIINIKKS
jgi:SAM-dependent methyltransferase